MTGTATLAGILVLGIVTTVFKLIGPVTAGGRQLPPRLATAAELLPTALITGLIVVQVAPGPLLGARSLGVAAAGLAVLARAPFAVVVLVGAGTAAILRALGLS
jgi:branched-subunit amino acid transport protein